MKLLTPVSSARTIELNNHASTIINIQHSMVLIAYVKVI